MTGPEPERPEKAVITPFADLLGRLEEADSGLRLVASDSQRFGLTSADPKTGEQWDGGQVWAHLAEFVPYWIEQARVVMAGGGAEPVPFGRVKTDPGRIASIAERRLEPTGVLAAKTAADIRRLGQFLREIDRDPANWEKLGVHSTLGVMSVGHLVDEFLVGHLEEHLRQLRELG